MHLYVIYVNKQDKQGDVQSGYGGILNTTCITVLVAKKHCAGSLVDAQ